MGRFKSYLFLTTHMYRNGNQFMIMLIKVKSLIKHLVSDKTCVLSTTTRMFWYDQESGENVNHCFQKYILLVKTYDVVSENHAIWYNQNDCISKNTRAGLTLSNVIRQTKTKRSSNIVLLGKHIVSVFVWGSQFPSKKLS